MSDIDSTLLWVQDPAQPPCYLPEEWLIEVNLYIQVTSFPTIFTMSPHSFKPNPLAM